MNITGFELLEIRLPLKDAFASSASVRRDRRILLLRVESDEGVEGWSECVAGEDPSYAPETVDTAWHVLGRFILPELTGIEVLGPEDLTSRIAWIRGHPMARAAAEMAGWDLQARELGVPLWELLGGEGAPVAVGVSLGLQPDVETLLERVERHVAEGYGRVKLKIAPGRDVEIVRAVRSRFPELALMADANGAYDLSDVVELQALDELELQLLEQPFPPDDLLSHARARTRLRTPICLDESIASEDDAALALELPACDVVSVKPGRVGGHAVARNILRRCGEVGVGAWCGGMLETGIGRAHSLALATLSGFGYTADLSASDRYWDRDVVSPEFGLEDGHLIPPSGAGIGVEPDRERIGGLTVRAQTFGTLVRPVVSG